MAAATSCCSSLFPFSVVVATSSSQEITSRPFKLRSHWTLQRLKPLGLGGSWLYCSARMGKCRCMSRLKYYDSVVKVRSSNVNIGAGSYEDGSLNDSQRNLARDSNSQASRKSCVL